MTSRGGLEVDRDDLKANLWEVLAIIGVTQILLMPVIAASTRVRTVAWIALRRRPSASLVLVQLRLRVRHSPTAWIDFLRPGEVSRPGTAASSAPIGWAIPMLLGTIAYDVVSSRDALDGHRPALLGAGSS